MNTLQGRSLCAFQNLLTVLPHDALGGKNHLVGVWRSLLELMQSGGQFLHPDALAEVMGALIENCSAHGSLVGLGQCVCVCVCACVCVCVCVCGCVCVGVSVCACGCQVTLH